jgi:hypothetical protein
MEPAPSTDDDFRRAHGRNSKTSKVNMSAPAIVPLPFVGEGS